MPQKKGNPRRPPKKEKAKATCPRCGQETEQILECPVCRRDGCAERCIAGGRGTPCNECDDQSWTDDDGEDGAVTAEED